MDRRSFLTRKDVLAVFTPPRQATYEPPYTPTPDFLALTRRSFVRLLASAPIAALAPLPHFLPDTLKAGDVFSFASVPIVNPIADFMLGDVINLNGPSVPRELVDAFWIVQGFHEDGSVKLSAPYADAECTLAFMAQPPTRSQAR